MGLPGTRLFGNRSVSKSATVVLAALVASATAGALPSRAAAPPIFNVKTYGALGNGTANDAPAIQRALQAAGAAGASGFGNAAVVEFPGPGTYVVNNTIHLVSNAVIQLDAGVVVTATSGAGFDPPEPNPFANACPGGCEDVGHQHLNNAMFRGDQVSNVGFTGSGRIDGGGHFTTGNPSPGNPDKLISITNCDTVSLSGITITRGGHFEALINGCNNVVSDHLDVEAATSRDGWNIINTANVTITNITAHGSDDALSFKSDWALGKNFPNGPATVTGGTLSAGCCNAFIFGPETCSDFSGYHLSNLSVTSAGKSGLAITDMDGAHISDVAFDHIQMNGSLASLLFMRVGARGSCGSHPPPGSISGVRLNAVTATSSIETWSPTLWGLDSTHNISNVAFDDVHFTVPGGGSGNPDMLPSDDGDRNPRDIGARPAFGLFMHDVSGVSVSNSSFTSTAPDGRPMIDVIGGAGVCVDQVTGSSSSGASDIHFNGVTGYSTATVGSLRVTEVGSSPGGSCPGPSPSPPTCANPGAVGGVTATATGSGTVNVTWAAPTNDGGCAIDAYAVYAFSYTASPQMLETSDATGLTASGLTTGSYYTFTVIGHNQAGWGAGWSGWSNWALP